MWQPDSTRDACNRCGNEFTFFNRKHHCRHCGNLFDDGCSNFYVPVYNPVSPPGIFTSMFADKNSGVQRVCHGCFHRFYAYICVTQGFWGMKTEIFGAEDEATRYMAEQPAGIVMQMGTAKIVLNKNPNDPASTAKFLEKAKGKARKIMGENFFEEQARANGGVLKPSASLNYTNTQQQQQQQQQNNFSAAPAATMVASPLAPSPQQQNTNNTNFAQQERDKIRRTTANQQNDDDSQQRVTVAPSAATNNNLPLPQFSYVVCVCLSTGARRLRFLQPDVHTDRAKLVLDVQKLTTEEFEAAGKFIDQTAEVEAVVLLNSDWKTVLFAETARFFYRTQPYVDSTIEQVMKNERFVVCSHTGGRPQCSVIEGGAAARKQLFENAEANISSVIVAASGEPIGHTCRDVSWRRDLVDRADSEGLKLLYGASTTKLVFVASTIPSANCDVRISATLWDLEQATQGQIRTTCQGWIWDKEQVDKRCIVSPFLAGSLAPPSASPAQQDTVVSTLRKLFVQSKQSAPLPDAAGGAAAAASTTTNTQSQPASPLATTSTTTQPTKPNNNTNRLAEAPPRPGATAAASSQAQQLHASTPNPLNATSAASIPECNICMENFNTTDHKPLLLGRCCGHSICASCWQGILQSRRPGTETVACPRCRQELEVSIPLIPNRTLMETLGH